MCWLCCRACRRLLHQSAKRDIQLLLSDSLVPSVLLTYCSFTKQQRLDSKSLYTKEQLFFFCLSFS